MTNELVIDKGTFLHCQSEEMTFQTVWLNQNNRTIAKLIYFSGNVAMDNVLNFCEGNT